MQKGNLSNMKRTFSTSLTFALLLSVAVAQAPQKPRPAHEDIVRISTELVQTDVVVTDKNDQAVPAQQGSAGPDVAIQVIVIRGDQPVLTKPLIKVVTNGLPDTARIPYGEDFGLGDLPVGRYILQINAIDRIAKKTATQQTRFSIHCKGNC